MSSSLPPQTRASQGERLESFDVTEAMLGTTGEDLNDDDSLFRTTEIVTRSRSIPVPTASTAEAYPPTASAASSQGSSGSAFLSQVLNSNSQYQHQQNQPQLLSHTPPTQLGTSYENAHFGKRPRSGSVSGRLRSASEYLEEKGLLDRQTKSILKDLIIIGDEELQQALDCYEEGDPSQLEQMIQSGALQNRLPQDLDILGDLDLDFLTMDDEDMGIMPSAVHTDQNIEALPDQYHHHEDDDEDEDYNHHRTSNHYDATDAQVAGALHAMAQQQLPPAKAITPSEDISLVGDMEFAGEFVSDHSGGGGGSLLLSHHPYASKEAAAAAASCGESPPDGESMSEYDKRLRSNSLFSALLDKPTTNRNIVSGRRSDGGGDTQYGQWMDPFPQPPAPSSTSKNTNVRKSNPKTTSTKNLNRPGGITINKPRGRPKTGTSRKGGLAASLEADEKRREREDKKRERQEKKVKKQEEKKAAAVASSSSAMEEDDGSAAQQQHQQHVPGSGVPHSLDDPLLRFSIDASGLQQCERPDGWIGAYSPESRRIRLERFLVKRPLRVWTKTVKYDVRKNFADSRLRVKGRFVKKEDELMMRELISLT